METRKSPMVSVLMTAYNREKYIAEAIESVLASEFTNFELIVLDDASNDNTFFIAKSYETKEERIKVYRNELNLGQFGNRNKAASYASGTYLKYVDSDDYIYPFTLKMMVAGMQQFPDAALGFCFIEMASKLPFPYQINPSDAFNQHFFEGGLLFIGPSGLIIKREVFESVNGFEEFGMPSDNHFSLKVAGKYPVVAMARDLFWWRIHEGQVFILNKTNYFNILNNYQYINDVILKYSPLEGKKNKLILKNQRKIFFLNILRLSFKKAKPILAIKLLLHLPKKQYKQLINK